MKKAVSILYILLFPLLVWSTGQLDLIITGKNGIQTTIQVQDITKISLKYPTGIQNTHELSSIIKTFELFQNFPNPFNPITTIKYQVPQNGHVHVTIFNSLGERVRDLIDTFQVAGDQMVIWDGMNNIGKRVSSGLYIYQIHFQSKVLSKKMLLLK